MQSLTIAVTLVTMLLGVVLSIRLLRLAAHTRKAPELAMGVYCALVTAGTLLGVAAFREGVGAGVESGSERIRWLSAAFTLCIGLGTFALAVGIWRTFFAGERWMALAVTVVGLWLGASWLACILPGRPVTLGDATLANALFLSARLAVYGFGAFQAFRYAHMLERRAALGLADALAAHQIRLWGTAWICVAVVGSASFLVMHVAGRDAFAGTLFPLLLAGVNASAWICTWLAFFPPVAYQHWAARARAAA